MVTQNIKTQGHFFRTGLVRALSILRPTCHALIAPDAVVLDTGGNGRPLVRQRRNQTGSLEEQFDTAVSDLLQLMDASGTHGRRLHLVVSDFWARPLVLPLPGTPTSDEEVDIVLQSQYRRTYGDLMDGWRWCWERQGVQLVAVAWPAKGLAALADGMARRAGTLASARPLAIDIASQALGQGVSSWLVIIERHSATLVRQQEGVWQDWCVMSGALDIAVSLPLQLARETARRRDDCRTLTLVDLNGAPNLERIKLVKLIKQTLADAGWSVSVRGANETGTSLACRLSQAIASGSPV